MAMAEQAVRARRRLTWRGKLALAVASPIAFLGLAELALAVAGYQPHEVRAPYERFSARKAPGTVRIMVLGGSAAAGYPFAPRGGPAPFLRELLRDVAPGQRTEVLNCGVNALASAGLTILARKLLDYQPDALIIYSGHNEFYNMPDVNRLVAKWDPEPPSWIRRSRTLAMLADTVAMIRGGPPEPPHATRAEQAAVGTLGVPNDYTPGMLAPPYEARLREIVWLAGERKVPVVLCTPASNLRDVPPPCPRHRPGLTAEQLAAWQAAYQEGRTQAAAGRHEAALAAFAKAAAIDREEAGLLYDQARSLWALGKQAEAKPLFVAARDRDYMPMRATSPILDAVRRVALEPGVALADAEAVFAEASPGGVPGDELFLDHVHLTLRGAMILAECWAHALERGGLLGGRAGWDWPRARAQETYERDLRLAPEFVAQGYMFIGSQCAGAEAGGRLVAGFRRPQFVEHARERGSRLMAEALRLDPAAAGALQKRHDPYVGCYLANAYLRLGQVDQAIRLCQGVMETAPDFPLAHECLAKARAAKRRVEDICGCSAQVAAWACSTTRSATEPTQASGPQEREP